MKKIVIISSALICVLVALTGYTRSNNKTTVQLYFVDSSMLRLIPSDFVVTSSNPETAAKQVITELIQGRDSNNKILRLIPDIKDGLSVEVERNTAIVNMSSEFIKSHSNSRQHETLTIYQIVNSLTSIDGIVNVKFTIDGEAKKDFKGFCDMRETFIPDYYV